MRWKKHLIFKRHYQKNALIINGLQVFLLVLSVDQRPPAIVTEFDKEKIKLFIAEVTVLLDQYSIRINYRSNYGGNCMADLLILIF